MLNFILPKLCLKVEKWKWNKEYRVYVSNFGQFKNEHKQPLPIKISNKGYCFIKTEAGLKNAHRLVMLTWKPIPNAEELTIDHLDHNKRNNAVDNLEWVTAEENWRRAADDFVTLENEEKIPQKTINNIPEHPLIKSGKQSFTSYAEAAQFVIKNKNMPKEVCQENIIKHIRGAVQNEQMYCGRKWKVVI